MMEVYAIDKASGDFSSLLTAQDWNGRASGSAST